MDNQDNQNNPNNQPPQPYPPNANQPTSDSAPIPPTQVATNYSPVSPNVQPTVEQNPQPFSQAPQPYIAQQPAPIQGAPSTNVAKKRSLVWLWITLIVVIALVISAIVTALVSVNNANSVAKTYSSSLKVYLSDVADTVSGSSSSLDATIKEVDDIKKPVLKSAFLSNLSTEYKEAQANTQKANSVVSEAKTEAELYNNLYTFYTDYTSESQNMVNDLYLFSTSGDDVDLAMVRLSNLSATCNKMAKMADEAKLPEKSFSALSEVQEATGSMCTSLSDLETAIRANNRNSVIVAGNNLQTASDKYSSAYSLLKKDYEGIASSVKELAKPAQELADKL